jgi:S1-C subfamily serine protease
MIVAALASCGASSSKESHEPQPDLDDAALSSAVDVRAIGCQKEPVRGAGAVVDGGFVLTAAHVVAGANSITVRPAIPDGAGTLAAHLVAIDPAADLALLSTPGYQSTSLALGRASASDKGVAIVFRDLTAIAVPFVITRPVTVRIFDIYHTKTVNRDGYQVAVEIEPGDSGAVLVGPTGTADGVLYAKSKDTEDRAWATSTSTTPSLLDRARRADPNAGIDPGLCAR